MNFDSYTDLGVEAAAGLVNLLTPGFNRGRAQRVATNLSDRQRRAEEAETTIWGGSGTLSDSESEGLYDLAERLRPVFEASARGAQNDVARLVNALLRDYHAAPQLAHHDSEPWHLHFHSQEKEAGRARARGATCATALAIVVGTGGGGRLGVCRADRCNRVFVDTSRNASKQFCSPSCMSRHKVASFRARRATASGPGRRSGAGDPLARESRIQETTSAAATHRPDFGTVSQHGQLSPGRGDEVVPFTVEAVTPDPDSGAL
ncbi:MAG: CGNR zinc finger domain-containing protein [Candidatus Dormibacteria bacterium]